MKKFTAFVTTSALALSIVCCAFTANAQSYIPDLSQDSTTDSESETADSDMPTAAESEEALSEITAPELLTDEATETTEQDEADDSESEAEEEDDSNPDSDVPYTVIYRMYNPNSGEHFYTTSVIERNALYKAGWDAEGIGWIAPQNSSIPIYRMYNGFEHHYTTDWNEVSTLLSIEGWIYEGTAFYSNTNNTVPMYRLYNPAASGAGAHHYTESYIEKAHLTAYYGWKDEGVAWYNLDIDSSTFTVPGLPERYEHNIKNTESYATIEADVKLGGNGSGSHAKLVFQTPTSAVSFGIQYDEWAKAPYTGQTFFLCENISSNAEGGQTYIYYNTTERNIWQHLMMTYEKNGKLTLYVNGEQVGQVWNPYLSKDDLYCSVEGSGRLDGDYIEASFKNIRMKSGGVYDETKSWPTYNIITNDGLKVTKAGFDSNSPSTGSISISGTIQDIEGFDWDSAYNRVSGVVHIGDAL